MIRRISRLSIPEIRNRIASATNQQIRERWQMELLVAQSQDGIYIRPILRQYRRDLQRLRETILEEDVGRMEIRRRYRQILLSVTAIFGQQIDRIAEDQIAEMTADFDIDLTTPQKRALTGLPLDQLGRVKPRPGSIPDVLTDESTSLGDILRSTQQLTVMRGDIELETQNVTVEELFTDIDIDQVVSRTRRDISNEFRVKLRRIHQVTSRASEISNALEDGPATANRIINRIFAPNPDTSGIINNVRLELRHEALRIRGELRDRIRRELDDDINVGYILHSRFLPTTDPLHATNDGNRYYKDNRRGSAALWADRLIPPYRKNCVCFTQDIFEDPDGEEFFADFTVAPLSGARRIVADDVGGQIWDIDGGGYRRITEADVGTTLRGRRDFDIIEPRDVGTWSDWFDAQREGIKRTLVGDARFDAVRSQHTAVYDPRYSDFVMVNGRWMTPQQIREEGRLTRDLRTNNVRVLIRNLQRNAIRAWERGDNKWALDANREEAYNRRLEIWLTNWLRR